MIPTSTGLIVIILGIWCQFGSFNRTLTATVLLTIFEAANAADLPALGSASITPAKLFLPFLVLRVISMRGGFGSMLGEIAPRRVLFVYLLLLLWVIPSGIFLPRLFQGAVAVNTLDRSMIDGGPVPLQPSSGNITQSVYAMGSFTLALCVAVLARKPGGSTTLLQALMVLTGLDIGFAVLDLVTAATHTGFLLDVIHTGNYAFLTEDESNGLKRISGSFAEASAFASFSLDLLGVNIALFMMRVRTRLTGFFSLALIFFLLLSTSSTAYVGLAIFGMAFAVYAAWSLLVRRNARALKVLIVLTLAGGLTACTAVLLAPEFAATAWKIIDTTVLNKATSDSALERGSLNTQAAKIFIDTYGLGAGIGATRTSNYIYLLASNLGIIGLVLFTLLIVALVAVRPRDSLSSEARSFVIAARVGILGSLVPAALIATIFDLGPLFYVLVGIAASGGASINTARAPQLSTVSSRGASPAAT